MCVCSFQCLYCEKEFPERQTLKDHMRKKQHRKLNPENRAYDKYYIVNYLELGKTWRELDQEEEEERKRAVYCVDVDERCVCACVQACVRACMCAFHFLHLLSVWYDAALRCNGAHTMV